MGGGAALACVAAPKSVQAISVVCVNCSTIWQQMMEYGQQVYSVGVQLQEYRTQLMQYSNMIQNTVALPSHLWNMVSQDIVHLKNIANIGALLEGPSGGILGTLNKFDAAAYQALSVGDMVNKYNSWGQMAGENIITMQKAMGLASNQMANDAALFEAVQRQSQNATGQVQVLQAANTMASLNYSATQQMHQTMMVHAQQIGAYNATLASRQAIDDQATISFLSGTQLPMTGGKRY